MKKAILIAEWENQNAVRYGGFGTKRLYKSLGDGSLIVTSAIRYDDQSAETLVFKAVILGDQIRNGEEIGCIEVFDHDAALSSAGFELV